MYKNKIIAFEPHIDSKIQVALLFIMGFAFYCIVEYSFQYWLLLSAIPIFYYSFLPPFLSVNDEGIIFMRHHFLHWKYEKQWELPFSKIVAVRKARPLYFNLFLPKDKCHQKHTFIIDDLSQKTVFVKGITEITAFYKKVLDKIEKE